MILCAVLLLVVLLYIGSTACRTGHPGLAALKGWAYAHRGLHGDGVPENSLVAFQKAVDENYGIELDVHLLADGGLGVIHDSTLERTTGAQGVVEDLTCSQLNEYFLEGSDQSIPSFDEVLRLVDGKIPLIVELKPKGDNYAVLCQNTCRMLDAYGGVYCLESFDPRCIFWLRRHRPELIRGQLTEDYFRSASSKIPWPLKFILKHQMFNFLTFPDFVAYRYSDRKTVSNVFVRKLWGVQGVSWTLKSQQEHNCALHEGWIPIFEGYNP